MNFTPEGVAMWQRHSHAKQKALWHKDLEHVEYFANPFQSWQSGKERSLKMPMAACPFTLIVLR